MKGFVEHFKKNKTEVLHFIPPPPEAKFRSGPVRDGTSWVKKSLGALTIWDMSFMRIRDYPDKEIGPLALETLRVSGFLDRTGISMTFLLKLIGEKNSKVLGTWNLGRQKQGQKLADAVKLLEWWHLIEKVVPSEAESEADAFSLHPLVQDWIKFKMSESEWGDYVIEAAGLVEKHLAVDHDELLEIPLRQKSSGRQHHRPRT
jgi:hypothetical protein